MTQHIQRKRAITRSGDIRYLAYCTDPIDTTNSVPPGRFRAATCITCLRRYARATQQVAGHAQRAADAARSRAAKLEVTL